MLKKILRGREALAKKWPKIILWFSVLNLNAKENITRKGSSGEKTEDKSPPQIGKAKSMLNRE